MRTIESRAVRWLAVCVAFTAFLGCRDVDGPTDDPTTIRMMATRLSPTVTEPGRPFTLELRITGARGPVVHAHPNETLGLLRNGVELDSLILHDDGSHGDATAADGWFSLDGLVLPPALSGIAAVTLGRFSNLHEPAVAHTNTAVPLRISFRTADPAVIGRPTVLGMGPNARATAYTVSLAHPRARGLSEPDLEAIVRGYYELFPDDRDFLVVMAPPTAGEEWSARAYQIRNDVLGLGLVVARWRDFGSRDRLRLVVHSRQDVFSSGPQTANFCLLNHELLHTWAAYLGEPLVQSFHWRSPGLARATSGFGDDRGCILNDLELYLAGLLPADSVANILDSNGYTMAQLLGARGARSPAAGVAPREFAIGFVHVSEEVLTDHELAYFDYIAREYVSALSQLAPNWSMTTGGRSSLSAALAPLVTASRHEAASSRILPCGALGPRSRNGRRPTAACPPHRGARRTRLLHHGTAVGPAPSAID